MNARPTEDGPKQLKTTPEWQALARIDPLYVVASWPGKEGAWTDTDFYALGESDWADCRHHWQHYWPELGGRCLEIGCGAGRMTRQLAQTFAEVVATDVSLEMIELARRACPEVTFYEVVGNEIPLPDKSVDGVFSTHVLQHLDSLRVVGDYLAEAYRVLRPGGTLMVQMILRSKRNSLLRNAAKEARLWHSRRALRRGKKTLRFRGNAYRPEEIRDTLVRIGYSDIELRVFPMQSNGDPHSFWLARRSAGAT